jgi:hypothetical protein
MLLAMSASQDRPPRGFPTPLALLGAVVVATSAAVVAIPAPAGAATDQPLVFVGFDDLATGVPASTGSLPVTTAVSSSGGGTIAVVDGADGSAADFPAWDGSASPYKRVAVTVRSKDASDPLSPGLRDFSFGADFTLDPRTQGGNDNGNNLVQRGLYGDDSQYKLQIDEGHVSCRIEGSRGAPYLKSATAVDRNTWYSATCSRIGGVMTLTVQRLGGAAETTSTSSTAGSVDMGSSSVPLSIGAKVSPSGNVVKGNADQFNGRVDDVFVDITD